MSNIKELIRQEIGRRKDYISVTHFAEDLLSFLDTLPNESEQPTKGYDEAYLNEKIAKASKSWEGVDVDKFMDEIRGREPETDCHDLTEAAGEYLDNHKPLTRYNWGDLMNAFKAGAEWQRKQMPMPEDTVLFQKGVEEGKRLMMEGAVEGFVGVHIHDKRADVTVNSGYLPKEMGIKGDSKVKIIIVKEDEQ